MGAENSAPIDVVKTSHATNEPGVVAGTSRRNSMLVVRLCVRVITRRGAPGARAGASMPGTVYADLQTIHVKYSRQELRHLRSLRVPDLTAWIVRDKTAAVSGSSHSRRPNHHQPERSPAWVQASIARPLVRDR